MVPLPSDEHVLLTPPDAAEAAFVMRGFVSAAAGPGGLTEIQRLLFEALMRSLTGHRIDAASAEPVTAAVFADGLARRNAAFRSRIVQLMVLGEMVLTPIPAEVSERVARVRQRAGGVRRARLGGAVVRARQPGHGCGRLRAQRLSRRHRARHLAAHQPGPRAGLGRRARRPGAGRPLGRPGRAGAGHDRPRGARVLPLPRVRHPRPARFGAAAAGPARLGARARRLRHHRGERDRGVRVHRPRQRRTRARSACSRWW